MILKEDLYKAGNWVQIPLTPHSQHTSSAKNSPEVPHIEKSWNALIQCIAIKEKFSENETAEIPKRIKFSVTKDYLIHFFDFSILSWKSLLSQKVLISYKQQIVKLHFNFTSITLLTASEISLEMDFPAVQYGSNIQPRSVFNTRATL